MISKGTQECYISEKDYTFITEEKDRCNKFRKLGKS